jgi:hypothetical protein
VAQQEVRGLTRMRRVPQDWVELKHDGIEGTHHVPNDPRAIAHWEERGWSVVGETKKAAAERRATTNTEGN